MVSMIVSGTAPFAGSDPIVHVRVEVSNVVVGGAGGDAEMNDVFTNPNRIFKLVRATCWLLIGPTVTDSRYVPFGPGAPLIVPSSTHDELGASVGPGLGDGLTVGTGDGDADGESEGAGDGDRLADGVGVAVEAATTDAVPPLPLQPAIPHAIAKNPSTGK